MIQVLHLSHTDIQYDSRILKEALFLNSSGYNVSGFGVCDQERQGEKSFSSLDFRVIPLLGRRLTRLPRTLRHTLTLIELTAKFLFLSLSKKPALVHCHDTVVLPVGVMIKVLTGARLVYDAHELESNRNGLSRLQGLLTRMLEKALWPFVNHLIVVSSAIESWYKQNIGEKDSSVILNSPVFAKTQILDQPTDYLRKKFLISKNKKIFIYVGILGRGRGIDLILDAFTSDAIDSCLVFLGYGEFTQELLSIANKRKNIFVHEGVPHEEVVPIVASADVGLCLIQNVSLSDYFCLPNKLFEYSFAGIPVLASRFPAIEKMVKKFGLGICTDLNKEAVHSAIEKISNGMIITAPDVRGLKDLSWEAQEQKLLQAYKSLLKS